MVIEILEKMIICCAEWINGIKDFTTDFIGVFLGAVFGFSFGLERARREGKSKERDRKKCILSMLIGMENEIQRNYAWLKESDKLITDKGEAISTELMLVNTRNSVWGFLLKENAFLNDEKLLKDIDETYREFAHINSKRNIALNNICKPTERRSIEGYQSLVKYMVTKLLIPDTLKEIHRLIEKYKEEINK